MLEHSAFCHYEKRGELTGIRIEHPHCSAWLLLQGAQLLEFSPSAMTPDNLLWLSPAAEYQSGQAIRGGIPVCWPWFGAPEKNPEKIRQHATDNMAHGFARTMQWELTDIQESCHEVQLTLTLQSNDQTLKLWPFKFRLSAEFSFGKELALKLTTENTDQKSFSVSQALHTYFPTESVRETQVTGLASMKYTDALRDWKDFRQNGTIIFREETDRLYFHPQDTEIRAITPSRCTTLVSENSKSAVVWNPWTEKSKRLSQFGEQDFHYMFCIETANVMEDAKTLEPGQNCVLDMRLSSTVQHPR